MELHRDSEPPATLFAGGRPVHGMAAGWEAASQVGCNMEEAA
jgi:hypothetical protein